MSASAAMAISASPIGVQSNDADGAWVDIGVLADIPIRGARIVKSRTGCIAVFRTTENEAFAIDDKCPHKAGPLAQGIVHGKAVTCPLHNWVINLETGKAQGADVGKVKTYPLKIEAGRILLDVTGLTANQAT
jgi:nitrite reductase (NADH) small subunit